MLVEEAEQTRVLHCHAVWLRVRVSVRYAFIEAHRAEFSVRSMCRVLAVHCSGFDAWLKEPLSTGALEDA